MNSRALTDIVKVPFVFVGADASVREARELAAAYGVHHLSVRRGTELVGTTCACLLGRASEQARVAEAMRTDVATLPHTASASEAAQLLEDTGHPSLVVLEYDEPCGLLTRGDVAEWDWDADALAAAERCQCCGLAEQLVKLEDGHFSCRACLHAHGRSPAEHPHAL